MRDRFTSQMPFYPADGSAPYNIAGGAAREHRIKNMGGLEAALGFMFELGKREQQAPAVNNNVVPFPGSSKTAERRGGRKAAS